MSEYETIKNAIALIKTPNSRGTGYLIAQNLVVTCAHVIEYKSKGETLRIHVGPYKGDAVVEAIDEDADCAVLKLPQPINTTPLPLAARDFKRGDTWESYGYPGITGEAGHWLTGDVQDAKDKDTTGREAIVLYSREIAAADGVPPQGFSGSPVLVSGQVVGHLKQIIPDSEDSDKPRALMGTLYACPSEVIRTLLPEFLLRNTAKLQPPTVGYDPAWYVHRQEEENAINYLTHPGTPAVLWGPFRSGKTTLLQRILEKIEQQPNPAKIVRLNLGLFDKETTEKLDSMLWEMGQQLIELLAPTQDDLLEKVWKSPASPVRKMTSLMSKYLLPMIEGNLVLAIDKADEIWQREFKNDFFGMLRKWSQLAAEQNEKQWVKLRLVLVISSSPTSLIDDPKVSPFNLSDPIELDDLNTEQIKALAQKYRLNWTESQLSDVRALVGGQPYLLRVLMYNACVAEKPLNEMLGSSMRHKIYSVYYAQYRHWLNQNPALKDEFKRYLPKESTTPIEQQTALKPADIEQQTALKPADYEACHKLVRAGVLVEDNVRPGRYKLRYGIFRDLFQ